MATREVACKICGTQWKHEKTGGGRWPKYCSEKCKTRSRRLAEFESLICQMCDIVWERKRKGGELPRTCSLKCHKERRSIVQKRYREKNPEKIQAMKASYWQENKGKLIQQSREWRKNNPDKCAQYSSTYRKRNPDKRKRTVSNYYLRNREDILLHRRERYRKDPEFRDKCKGAKEVWRRRNPDQAQLIVERRRARKLSRFVEDVSLDALLLRDGHRCGICGGKIPKEVTFGHPLYPNLDHIIPLSKGGEHSYENAQPSHASCNSQKGNMVDGWRSIKPILSEDAQA